MGERTSNINVGIVGATGAVGDELIRILHQRGYPVGELRLLASSRSAGQRVNTPFGEATIRETEASAFEGLDVVFFAATSGVSREFAPVAADAGAWVIDNSSAFRMDEGVPLVVPEANAATIHTASRRIIANPNCSTIIMVVPLTPIHREFGIERIVVSTYQAVSGAGAPGLSDLEAQARGYLAGAEPSPGFFPEPSAFNVFSHDSAVDPESGQNVEEQKMIEETRKIWNDPGVRVEPTCIRVPVFRAHAESINLTLRVPTTEANVRELIAAAPGVRLIDDRDGGDFPTSLKASERDPVLVGRIRVDRTQQRDADLAHGFSLFVAGDQIRKGAALNAVQIAELLDT